MENRNLEILQQNLISLERSLFRLNGSFEKAKSIELAGEISDDDFDILENLTSRFSRTVDLIVNKLFRSIDSVELEDAGTLIDVVNRAEKRGIIHSSLKVRRLKDLRNEIVHEYETEDLAALFERTLESTPEVLAIGKSVKKYCLEKEYIE